MNFKPELLGKCGFYCGTCPTYINENCNGCIEEHMGGYDIKCTLNIDVGCYHVKCDTLYSATGALYRFCDELRSCYAQLEGQAEYKLYLENDLYFKVEMTTGGRALVTGAFREYPDKENILHFQMNTDQTCFVSVMQDIETLKNLYGGMEGKRC